MNKHFQTFFDNAKDNGNNLCKDNGNQNNNKQKSIPSRKHIFTVYNKRAIFTLF